MGTTKRRQSRRNNSRLAATSFLSNIALGCENDAQAIDQSATAHSSAPQKNGNAQNEYQQAYRNGSHGTPINALPSIGEDGALPAKTAAAPLETTAGAVPVASFATSKNSEDGMDHVKTQEHHRRRFSHDSSHDHVWHHKLTREDSDRPIASEKIKKKSQHANKENEHVGFNIMSVVRSCRERIKHTVGKKPVDKGINRGYLQQQLENHNHHSHREAISYAHFLIPSHSLDNDNETYDHSYNPYFLDNVSDTTLGFQLGSQGTTGGQALRPSELKRELNEQFRQLHPEIQPEMTLSKIRAIKLHLLNIGKAVDLEISSVAHAFVYFEKLVIKNIVTKPNRKLIAACCLFLAAKVNEAKGDWFEPLFEAIDNELGIDSNDIREHEFAVFADLEFNLYIRQHEFMPHFDWIFHQLEYQSIEEYIGDAVFYKVTET